MDRRLHAYRPDLADERLRGRVDAERFVRGEEAVVGVGAADLHATPDAASGLDTQLLFGEAVTRFETRAGWAWVQGRRDGYVGYVRAADLAPACGEPTHVVEALRTFRYARPDLKAPVRDALSLTTGVRVVGERDGFAEVALGGWIHAEHLAPVSRTEPDHVATALRFVGLPYRWGGKESVGLDCSALVQFALHRAGRACPRDSDMQARGLGVAVASGGPVERGDLLFLPGHVAIALDGGRVVHATAHGMVVRVEPLADLLARVEGGLTGVRRL